MIADILGIKKTVITSVGELEHRSKKNRKTRNDIVNGDRIELASLPVTGSKVCRKGNSSDGNKWILVDFTNSARGGDKLTLRHWQPIQESYKGNSVLDDYPAAAFNIPVQVASYTAQQYETFLEPLDRTWSKAETDFLFSLCKDYDLNFYVIHDRYRPSESGVNGNDNRTIESIKERYYSIAKKLLNEQYRLRIQEQHVAFENKKKELEKKPAEVQQFVAIYNRTIAELKDEHAQHPLTRFRYDATAAKKRKTSLDSPSIANIEETSARLLNQVKNIGKGLKQRKRPLKKEENTKAKKLQKKGSSVVEESIEPKICRVESISQIRPKPGATSSSQYMSQLFQALGQRCAPLVESTFRILNLTGVNTAPKVYTHELTEVYKCLIVNIGIVVRLRQNLDVLKQDCAFWTDKLRQTRLKLESPKAIERISDVIPPAQTIHEQSSSVSSRLALGMNSGASAQRPRRNQIVDRSVLEQGTNRNQSQDYSFAMPPNLSSMTLPITIGRQHDLPMGVDKESMQRVVSNGMTAPSGSGVIGTCTTTARPYVVGNVHRRPNLGNKYAKMRLQHGAVYSTEATQQAATDPLVQRQYLDQWHRQTITGAQFNCHGMDMSKQTHGQPQYGAVMGMQLQNTMSHYPPQQVNRLPVSMGIPQRALPRILGSSALLYQSHVRPPQQTSNR